MGTVSKGSGTCSQLLVWLSKHQSGDSHCMMLVDICQWRAAIGCFRASTQRSVRFHCARTLASMFLQVFFRLYKFACSFIFISAIILLLAYNCDSIFPRPLVLP